MAVQSKLRPTKEHLAQLASIYASHRPLVQRGLTVSFVLYALGSTYRSFSARPGQSSSSSSKRKGKGKETADSSKPRVAVSALLFSNGWHGAVSHATWARHQVDALFYQRLSRILRIVIPSIRSKEALLLFMHSSLLIFRTVISLYVAGLDGK